MNRAYVLLVRCAHLPGDANLAKEFAESTIDFQDWDTLISLAETHSMSPLLYMHLQEADAASPPPIKLQLQGLFLRHKRANEIRLSRLAEVLAVLAEKAIPVIVLKGAALAPLIYPTPGLRPMSDIDILVPPEQASDVQIILHEMGFTDSLPNDPTPTTHRHLPVVMQTTAEMAVSIEVHHKLGGAPLFPEVKTFAELWETAVSYRFNNQTATMLGYEDTLWHLYTHMMAEPARLIRIVDMVGFAEQFAQEINWQQVWDKTPNVIAALSVLHFAMPLSEQLRKTAQIPNGLEPKGAEVMLQNWPPLPHLWPGKTRLQIFTETFFPTEACLRLYYGVSVDRSIVFQRWLRHPARVFSWYVQWKLGRYDMD
jgi:hypothetical protein